MSPGEDLALRKEILVAHASLCRLKIRYQSRALRESLTWGGAAAAVVHTPAARDALFLLAAEGLGRERTARFLGFAFRALAIARLTGLVAALLRRQ